MTVDQAKLNEQIKATKNTILDLWNQRETNDISLREQIRKLAMQVEETGVPKQWVSSEVIRMFKANQSLKVYISSTLDSVYKTKYTIQQILSGDNVSIEECSIQAQEIKETLEKAKTLTPEDLGRGEFQDVAQLLYDAKNKYESNADRYNIPLPYTKSKLDDEDDEKIEEEAAPIPESEQVRKLQGIIVQKGRRITEALTQIFDDIEEKNYISEDPKQLEQFALGLDSFFELIRPVSDKKWGLDLLSWCDVIEKFYDQGGTYASSKSAVDVADMINIKTGKPIQRKITKEQIDAVHPKLLNNMRFIVTNFKFVLELFKNYRSKEQSYRAKRRVLLHDTLSEAA